MGDGIRSLVFVLIFQISLFSDASPPSPRFWPLVHGGEAVGETEPIGRTTVMLETDMQYCSAVIISPKALLTAAHCLPPSLSDWMLIHFRGLVEPALDRKALRFLPNPQYQDRQESTLHDLALVFFEGGLPVGFEVASLSSRLGLNKYLELDTLVTLAGYGEGGPLGQLMKVSLLLSKFDPSEDHLYFNQTRKKGICHGDSGGPAFFGDGASTEVIGIAAYTKEYDCNGYSVYTALSANHLEWIKKEVAGISLRP